MKRALFSELALADRGSSLCRPVSRRPAFEGLAPQGDTTVSTQSVSPAVATGTTAASTSSSYQRRIDIAFALAQLERSLTRLELRLLSASTSPFDRQRRKQLWAASVHALDGLLPR